MDRSPKVRSCCPRQNADCLCMSHHPLKWLSWMEGFWIQFLTLCIYYLVSMLLDISANRCVDNDLEIVPYCYFISEELLLFPLNLNTVFIFWNLFDKVLYSSKAGSKIYLVFYSKGSVMEP